jgi:hypothetical protein
MFKRKLILIKLIKKYYSNKFIKYFIIKFKNLSNLLLLLTKKIKKRKNKFFVELIKDRIKRI